MGLLTWLTENRVDTRRGRPVRGRRYSAPYAHVWDAIHRLVERRRGWTLVHADETRGLFTVVCRTPVFRFADDLAIWVTLDRHGLTRVDARSRSRVGRGDLGTNRRRVERLFRHLDRQFRPVR